MRKKSIENDNYRAIMAAVDRGFTNRAEIAQIVGCSPWVVHYHLGVIHDPRKWEADRKRHAEFFDGLSPQAEYDRHTEKRRDCDDY
jgi:hypothetical protein